MHRRDQLAMMDEEEDQKEDFFAYVDEERDLALAKLDELRLRRQEILEEMSSQLSAFQSPSLLLSEDDTMFQRHADLAMSLASVQAEQKHHQQRYAAALKLFDKKEKLVATRQRRLEAIQSSSNALGTEEMRLIIENEASFSLEVEILIQERRFLEIQLKEARDQAQKLQLQCGERDRRILEMERKIVFWHAETESNQTSTSVSSRAELARLAMIRSNMETQSALLQQRRNSKVSLHPLKPAAPLTVEVPTEEKSTHPRERHQRQLRDDILSNLGSNSQIINGGMLAKDGEAALPNNACNDDKTRAQEKRSLGKNAYSAEDIKAREKELRDPPSNISSSTTTLQHKSAWVLDLTADDASIYNLGDSIYTMGDRSSLATSRTNRVLVESSLLSIPEAPHTNGNIATLNSQTNQHQASVGQHPQQSQGDLAHLSTTQEVDEDDSSRSAVPPTSPDLREDIQAGLRKQQQPTTGNMRTRNVQPRANRSRPGAVRVAPNGMASDNDSHRGFVGNDDFLVSAVLVDDESKATLDTLRREHELEERERHLREREAALEQQAQKIRSMPLAVAPVDAVAAALSSNRSTSTMGSASESLPREFDPALMELGPGPLRFRPSNERTMREQFLDISDTDYECFQSLQRRWEERRQGKVCAPYSEAMILRFLRNTCKKDGSFSLNKAWKAMKKVKEPNLFLSASRLENQLLSATLFPVPGLLSHAGLDMFYMKPARYFPRKTKVKDVIENLVYVMNTMLERENPCKNGIGFVACMNDWKMVNFEINYCYQFMMGLQGALVPVMVELFLIVNPPGWFGAIWKIMRPMLAPSFRKKVKVIKESMLSNYLMEGYEEFLPDDFSSGKVKTTSLVEDFVSFRKCVEKGNKQLHAKITSYSEDDSQSQYSVDSTTLASPAHIQHVHQYAYVSTMSSSSSQKVSESSSVDDDDASIHCDIDETYVYSDADSSGR
eukprot:scaffold6992_cov102-Cylindrotheca_fusiformis.AAC.9